LFCLIHPSLSNSSIDDLSLNPRTILGVPIQEDSAARPLLKSRAVLHGAMLTVAYCRDVKLNFMQQPTAPATSPATPSFAGLLAALASSPQRPLTQGDESLHAGFSAATASSDGLEDDIATLSYERALRAHARYRTTIQPRPYISDPRPADREEPSRDAPAVVAQPTADRAAAQEQDSKRVRSTPFERNLKSASITIRLSKAECAQLQRRAADAGLTVSAYLRSCTFEAESLRAMVKDTLAELRLAKAHSNPACPEPPRRSKFRKVADWLARQLSPRQTNRRVVRA
jgi:predicted DNA binding CopG/RHH family protein